jgi:hypothetical protein
VALPHIGSDLGAGFGGLLLVAAAVLAFTRIDPLRGQRGGGDRIRVEECAYCPINGPPLHPTEHRHLAG